MNKESTIAEGKTTLRGSRKVAALQSQIDADLHENAVRLGRIAGLQEQSRRLGELSRERIAVISAAVEKTEADA